MFGMNLIFRDSNKVIFQKFNLSSFRIKLLTLFLFGFFLRFIPDLLVFQQSSYPVGFDIIGHYAPTLMGFDPWRLEPLAAPLIYFILKPFVVVFDVFLVLRITACVLYGLLAVSAFYFSSNGLNWGERKSFIGSFFLTLQISTLRISLDLFRIELGIIFFLLLLPWLKNIASRRSQIVVSLLSLAIVMTHEMISAVAVFVIIGLILLLLRNRRKNDALRLFLFTLPSLIIFLVMASIGIGIYDVPWGRNALTNYFEYYGGSYFVLLGDVSYNVGLYLPFLPLTLIGFWRNRLLFLASLFLLGTSFSCIFFPWLSLSLWWEWLLLLAIPLIFYAVNGLEKLGLFKKNIRAYAGLIAVIILFSVYAAIYIPHNMNKSSIDFDDIPNTMGAFDYINNNSDNSSCLILEERFRGWGLMYFGDNRQIISYPPGLPYHENYALMRYLNDALETAMELNCNEIYLVWYADMMINYSQFQEIYKSENIGVYKYFVE